MFTTAIFDLDGTLLDTLQDLAAAGNHTLTVLGLPTHPVAAYRQMVGNGVPKLVERMLPPACRGSATQAVALQVFSNYYEQHMLDFTAPYPGISQMLAALRGRGVHLGVVSNKSDDFVQPIVERFFPGVFSAVCGLREGVPPKPDPASVLQVLVQLAADPAATLYCGDSDVDIHTAHNAQLTSCGVLWGFRTEAELAEAGAEYLAEDAAALEYIILQNGE